MLKIKHLLELTIKVIGISISSKEVKEWSLKIGRCIAKEFIVNAGMDNIDLDKSTCQ